MIYPLQIDGNPRKIFEVAPGCLKAFGKLLVLTIAIIQLVTLPTPAMLGLVSLSHIFHSISEKGFLRERKSFLCKRIPSYFGERNKTQEGRPQGEGQEEGDGGPFVISYLTDSIRPSPRSKPKDLEIKGKRCAQ